MPHREPSTSAKKTSKKASAPPAKKDAKGSLSIDEAQSPVSKSSKKGTKTTPSKASQPSKIPKEPIKLSGLIWERQPGEPIDWFEKFCAYRNSAKPCINAVYRQYLIQKEIEAKAQKAPKGTELDTETIAASVPQQNVPGNWKRAVKVFRWSDRVEAFRSEQQHHANELWKKRSEQLREEGWQSFEILRGKALEMLKYPIVRHCLDTSVDKNGNPITQTVIEPAKWTVKDIATLLKTAHEIGNGAIGNYARAMTLLADAGFDIALPDERSFSELLEEDLGEVDRPSEKSRSYRYSIPQIHLGHQAGDSDIDPLEAFLS